MNEPAGISDQTPRSRVQYDPADSNHLSRAVVEAIADAERVAPTEIDPLYDSIDLEALDAFVAHANESSRVSSMHVGVSLADWDLLVYGDGRIHVHEPGVLESCRPNESGASPDAPSNTV